MSRPIVVGYDGSDHAADALELGRVLARLADAALVVACAYPDDPLGESATAAEIAEGMRADAERTLARARGRMGADEADFRAIAGASPSRVLHELAEQLAATAIVVGATHHGTALRLLTGSTPEHVLDHAPCPVAVAPDGYATRDTASVPGPPRFAVAYDGSPESTRALEEAAELASAAGASLRLVTAVDVAAVSLYPPLDVTSYEQLAQAARERAREQLDAAAAEARARGFTGTVETEVLDGDAVQALVEGSAADDLLFAGSRGKGTFRRVLLGSVSRHLLREAACPVVVVPRGGS